MIIGVPLRVIRHGCDTACTFPVISGIAPLYLLNFLDVLLGIHVDPSIQRRIHDGANVGLVAGCLDVMGGAAQIPKKEGSDTFGVIPCQLTT